MEQAARQEFGGKIRLRICGILIEDNRILLVKHLGIGPSGFLWNPPGGGAKYGESYAETLKREFLEETHLDIEVGDFMVFNEHISDNLHALELFFKVKRLSGDLCLGSDPELGTYAQMMVDLKFWSKEEIADYPAVCFHKRLLDYF